MLGCLVVGVFARALGNGFVDFDDNLLILQNPFVRHGLTLQSIRWAFETTYAANWFPLTWLSLLLDVEVFGLNPVGFHATNLVLHATSTLVLYHVLAKTTGATGRSAFVAAVFALHPLHVESVAWAAARRDVLSGLFWMLTLWAYVRYAEHPASVPRYLLVVLALALGLLSKPVLVTLPAVLLLLDFWPLGRLRPNEGIERIGRLLLEKLPLLGLAVASSGITFWAQHSGGAVRDLGELSLADRAANAILAYCSYLAKALWPVDLAFFYPHLAGRYSWFTVLAALVGLAFGTILALRAGRRHRYLAVGWLWYLVTLVPMLGLVQVGVQGMADRYSYLPLVGPSLLVAWGTPDLLRGWRYRDGALRSGAAAAVVAMALLTWLQIGHWRDTFSLYDHALQVTEDNYVVHYLAGRAWLDRGRYAEAGDQLEMALRIRPGWSDARAALGISLVHRQRFDSAILEFERGLARSPDSPKLHAGLGLALEQQGRPLEAIASYERALRLNPAWPRQAEWSEVALRLLALARASGRADLIAWIRSEAARARGARSGTRPKRTQTP